MNKRIGVRNGFSRVLLVLFLANMVTAWIACRHNFPTYPVAGPHYCSALIQRGIPGSAQQFTEWWQFDAWPCEYGSSECDTFVAPDSYCLSKLLHYINHYMAPGFQWSYYIYPAVPAPGKSGRDCRFTVVDPNPNVWPKDGVYPPTYGGPPGAVLEWNNPPASEASVYLWLLDKDGVTRTATPAVKQASADFAERTGLPDDTGTYIPGVRHIRFANLSIELATPFQFNCAPPAVCPNVTVNEFYIQNTGTIIAEHLAGDQYNVRSGKAKFFIKAVWNSGYTELCAVNAISQSITVSQGPQPHFTLTLVLGSDALGEPMTINVSLSKPTSVIPSFQRTQPHIVIADREITGPTANLEAHLSDAFNDINANRLFWFKDFEVPGLEMLLGMGNYDSLNHLSHLDNAGPFSYGPHNISFVAYNTLLGAYNTATMTLTRLRVAQFGIHRDGAWYLDLNDNGLWNGCGVDRCMSFGGASWDKPVAGDWVGSRYDGWTKLGVFRATGPREPQTVGRWYLDQNGDGGWDGCGTTISTDRCHIFGLSRDIPVTGDWNGDGKTEIGVYRNGWWVLDVDGNGAWDDIPTDAVFPFGLQGDIPMTGDWNGDGITEVGVYRDGWWVLDMNGNGAWDGTPTDAVFPFGLPTDIPVTGDWNGDGKTEVGVYRSGWWVLDMDGNGTWNAAVDKMFPFGLPTDKPMTGIWW